jgi:hypothetical protein
MGTLKRNPPDFVPQSRRNGERRGLGALCLRVIPDGVQRMAAVYLVYTDNFTALVVNSGPSKERGGPRLGFARAQARQWA